MATLQTKITDHGIKQHFKTTEPEKAIFELVWNGFDAKAKNVDISLKHNDLGGIDSISILDDGVGIDVDNIANNFGKFNESSKVENFEQHGYRGRGRLAFHKVSQQATWYTKDSSGKQAKIRIYSSDLSTYHVDMIDSIEHQHANLSTKHSGTIVELFHSNSDLEESKLKQALSIEFGWFLALNQNCSLKLNNIHIEPPEHKTYRHNENIDEYNFEIQILLWDKKPTSEKSYLYLLNNESKVVYKKLSRFNRKGSFFISTYVKSDWFDNFVVHRSDLLSYQNEHNLSSPVLRKIETRCDELLRNIYDEFLKEFVENKIKKLEEQKAFPDYNHISDEKQREWREGNTKKLVRELYLADPLVFGNLNLKQQKIIIHLLDKISVSNENDSLIEILENVLELSKDSLSTFATQISRTKLENIISTIEVLQRRENVVHQLRELMNKHYKKVLETPDLQKIIENNTWIFGNSYETIGAEEDSFTKTSKSLRDKIDGINNAIDKSDIDDTSVTEEDINESNRQVDLFLARKFPFTDYTGKTFFRCIIIEIKKPSIALNYKHLRQLEDYKRILQAYPEFSSDNLKFELILIGRKISSTDTEIPGRLNSLKDRLDPGLVLDDGRFKCYVKNWYTLLDEFELTNNYLLENLKTQRASLEKYETKELVSNLQKETK